MSIVSATDELTAHSSDNRTYSLDFTSVLKDQTISSVDSVTVSPSGPTVGTGSANSSPYADDDTGRVVEPNKAVQFTFTGGTDGTDYTVTATVTTSGSDTLVGVMVFQVRDS